MSSRYKIQWRSERKQVVLEYYISGMGYDTTLEVVGNSTASVQTIRQITVVNTFMQHFIPILVQNVKKAMS